MSESLASQALLARRYKQQQEDIAKKIEIYKTSASSGSLKIMKIMENYEEIRKIWTGAFKQKCVYIGALLDLGVSYKRAFT